MSLKLVGQGSQSRRPIYKPASQTCNNIKSRKNTVFFSPQNATQVSYTGAANGALNSSSNQFTDFLLDNSIGYVSDVTLRVSLGFSDSTAAHLPSIVPTHFFCNRVEIWTPDGTLAETVYPEQLYIRSMAYIADPLRQGVASTWNLNIDGSQRNLYNNGVAVGNTYADWLADPTVVPADAPTPQPVVVSPSTYLYVPLTDTCLRSGIFLAGYDGNFKVRVYWASNIISQLKIDNTTTPNFTAFPQTVQINQPLLVVEEDVCDPAVFQEVLKAHREGVVDTTTIVQERMQIISNSTYLNNTFQNLYLTGFRNKCAGMQIHFQAPAPSNDRILQRLSFAQVQFLDARGNRIWSQLLDTDFLNSKLWNESVPSTFPQSGNADINQLSLVSFCADAEETLKKGCAGGFVTFTGQEQISINPSINAPVAYPTPTPGVATSITGYPNPMLYLTSYSYAHISCVQGKCVVRWE